MIFEHDYPGPLEMDEASWPALDNRRLGGPGQFSGRPIGFGLDSPCRDPLCGICTGQEDPLFMEQRAIANLRQVERLGMFSHRTLIPMKGEYSDGNR